MLWAADFETTTTADDCRVWAWAVCEIGNTHNWHYGTNISTFLDFTENNPDTYYFHNLQFDGEFILSELFRRGFTHEEFIGEESFTTMISGGLSTKFYKIEVCHRYRGKRKKNDVATFYDSYKKLPMSVDKIAKAFDLETQKLEIDYSAPRPIDHVLTDEEINYLYNDVAIIAQALHIQIEQGLDRLTIGSDALHEYKSGLEKTDWQNYYPLITPEIDAFIRKAYRGGWTYANPKYQGKILTEGLIYDVNSLYPSVMYDRALPIGAPIPFYGQYEPDENYPLYVQFLQARIKLKDGHLPTIQVKNNPFFKATEYVVDSDGVLDLYLTSVDMDLLFKHYDVEVIAWGGGFKFAGAKGLFCDYIDHWNGIKEQSTGGIRTIAKLMLNNLYGKFGTSTRVSEKHPHVVDGIIQYVQQPDEDREPVYIPMAAFITAYAREQTITAAQQHYDRFIYADTDSVHLIGTETPNNMEIHPTQLGKWQHETTFHKAKYVRAKTYMFTDGGGTTVKCAGMPDNLHKYVTYDNFEIGLELHGKLRPVHVPGGIVFEETTYTLSPN